MISPKLFVSSRREERRGEAPGPQPGQNWDNEDNYCTDTTALEDPHINHIIVQDSAVSGSHQQQPRPQYHPHQREGPFSPRRKVKILFY